MVRNRERDLESEAEMETVRHAEMDPEMEAGAEIK